MRRSELKSKPRQVRPSDIPGKVESWVLEDGVWRFDRLKDGPKPKPRKPISPASPAQRAAKRAVGYCIACGATEEYDGVPLDPAHIIPRAHGGCDSRFCTIPLCRICHDRMDGRAQPPIDLLKVLVGDWNTWRHHYQHALRHGLPVYVLERLSGARTQWTEAE